MEDFLTIFAPLTYHGPATPEDTVAAWRLVRGPTSSVLDLGCGPGNATLLLAQQPDVHVHALDGLEQSLDKLKARAEEAGLASKITLVHGDMAEPPFKPGTFDVVWSENSVYALGFEHALKVWGRLLSKGGTMVVSDLVWLSADVDNDIRAFWADEYPDMQDQSTREAQIEAAGWDLVGTHTLEHRAWSNYYEPLQARIDDVREELGGSEVISGIEREIAILKRQADGGFSYTFFVMTRPQRG